MNTQALSLEVKRITRLAKDGPTKAFCDVAVAGAYLIKGVKVVNGKRGVFVSMPREQGKDGKWYETVIPLTQEARDRLSDVVLETYEAEEPAVK